MINVKKNFASQFKDDIACYICKVQVDCQEHLLQCHELIKDVVIPVDVEYEDLFKNSDKQLRIQEASDEKRTADNKEIKEQKLTFPSR